MTYALERLAENALHSFLCACAWDELSPTLESAVIFSTDNLFAAELDQIEIEFLRRIHQFSQVVPDANAPKPV